MQWSRLLWAPCQGVQTRQQFIESERLDQVVVRALIKRVDPIDDLIARGKYEDAWTLFVALDMPQYRKAILARQTKVEHGQLVAVAVQVLAGDDAIRGDIHRKACGGEPPCQCIAQADRVFGDKNVQGRAPMSLMPVQA